MFFMMIWSLPENGWIIIKTDKASRGNGSGKYLTAPGVYKELLVKLRTYKGYMQDI